jgi:prephenate dehydrogenase
MSIGIVGYGRFGAAFASLLETHGKRWSAWDPQAPIADANRATSLQGLVETNALLVLAVPVDQFEVVLCQARPSLTAAHTVIDVGSVKQRPCQLLDEVLGDDIPHAGSHPLFGPLSIARAEPLRTVVCPSARHPAAAARATALFESLGSEVLQQSAEAHDRYMALTHGMAFFIARGLIDLGIGGDLRWAPPSFAALAASIAAVRADAGHLFSTIQRQNPHAGDTRRRFLAALQRIDADLVDQAGETAADSLALAAPLAAESETSAGDRSDAGHLAQLDRELVALLRRRQALVARPCTETNNAARRPSPELQEWARHIGLDPHALAVLTGGGQGQSAGTSDS